jgi:nucleotide-binding universal stress UspA family protein
VKRILHATDFSAASARAFRTALAWAQRERAELRLVHVLSPPAPVLEDAYMSARTWQATQDAARRDAERRLQALVRRATRAGLRVSRSLVTGIPFQQIVREAQRSRAGLVVMGTHGRTGLAGILMGSVARRVIALARCPVLTVRG